MKNDFSQSEKFFRNVLMHDEPGISPESSIVERLNYHFILSHPFRRVQNSFTGAFTWLFSMKSVALKASFASLMLAYMLLFGNVRDNSNDLKNPKLFQINTLIVDTNSTFKDTCQQTGIMN